MCTKSSEVALLVVAKLMRIVDSYYPIVATFFLITTLVATLDIEMAETMIPICYVYANYDTYISNKVLISAKKKKLETPIKYDRKSRNVYVGTSTISPCHQTLYIIHDVGKRPVIFILPLNDATDNYGITGYNKLIIKNFCYNKGLPL